jgi:hypothetical protein
VFLKGLNTKQPTILFFYLCSTGRADGGLGVQLADNRDL